STEPDSSTNSSQQPNTATSSSQVDTGSKEAKQAQQKMSISEDDSRCDTTTSSTIDDDDDATTNDTILDNTTIAVNNDHDNDDENDACDKGARRRMDTHFVIVRLPLNPSSFYLIEKDVAELAPESAFTKMHNEMQELYSNPENLIELSASMLEKH